MISRLRPVIPVSFDNEPLILTQSDMDASNFGVDESGKIVLLDFSQIGWLPLSFSKFTISCVGLAVPTKPQCVRS
ncbi:hypothetical protein F5887DRAFT_1002736 [Amanita rubescens]|nr:hypothetical protein F5887DRAFT_1014609 [Amanita rubescens]KAF8329954.1 hypothetical protein F5887DRAFT_1002736 [Amanita rubescens]